MPRGYFSLFGRQDPVLSWKVAHHIHEVCYLTLNNAVKVEAALDFHGQRHGYGRRKGYDLLRAGRWLKHKGWRPR